MATSCSDRPVICATCAMSGLCVSSGCHACLRASSGSTPRSTSASATAVRCARQSSGPAVSITPASSANAALCGAITSSRPPACGCRRYQRATSSTMRVDADHQLVLQRRIHRAVERLDGRPARDGARDLARDVVGAHHLGLLGARLGAEPRDERDALRVDDVVGHDRRHQLAAQRRAGSAGRRTARRSSAGSTRAARGRGTGRRPGSPRAAPSSGSAWRTRAARTAPGAPWRGPAGGARPSPRWSAGTRSAAPAARRSRGGA